MISSLAGENVHRDHDGLPDILGSSLRCHLGQLHRRLEGSQEIHGTRGPKYNFLYSSRSTVLRILSMFFLVWGFSVQAKSCWRLPFNNLCQVAIHVAFVHAFVNPLLFLVLHPELRSTVMDILCCRLVSFNFCCQLMRRNDSMCLRITPFCQIEELWRVKPISLISFTDRKDQVSYF